MYGYIYKTTNLVNGKIYIGQKHSNKFLNEKYLGSDKRLRDAIQHYGKENFKVELLEEVENEEQMDEREIYWIAFYNSTNKEIGYNMSEGGNVNRTLVGENNPFYGKKHSEETKKKMSEHSSHYMLGKKQSEETKEKIRQKELGKVVSIETRQKLSENAKHNPNYGMRGKVVSNDTKKKLSDAKKGKPSKAKGKIHITNDIEDKMIFPEQLQEYLDAGWRRGRKKFSKDACEHISNGHKGLKVFNKGKIWINNGIIKMMIDVDELESYLSKGWKRGIVKQIK